MSSIFFAFSVGVDLFFSHVINWVFSVIADFTLWLFCWQYKVLHFSCLFEVLSFLAAIAKGSKVISLLFASKFLM